MTIDAEPLIDALHADFMQRGVSINMATCGRDGAPTLVRATGCRVSPDRQEVTLFVSRMQAAPVIDCQRDNAPLAVVFSEPSTHRTVQLKGRHVRVGLPEEEDFQLVAAYRDAFVREVKPLGYDETLLRTLFMIPSADLVAIRFAPCEAYSQTPGPRAGEPLRRGA